MNIPTNIHQPLQIKKMTDRIFLHPKDSSNTEKVHIENTPLFRSCLCFSENHILKVKF